MHLEILCVHWNFVDCSIRTHLCIVVLDFHDDFDEFMDRDSDVAAASSTSHNITDWEVGVAHLSQHNILH